MRNDNELARRRPGRRLAAAGWAALCAAALAVVGACDGENIFGDPAGDPVAPTVAISVSPRDAGAGDSLKIGVLAELSGGVRSVGYMVFKPGGDTLSVERVETVGRQIDTTFVYLLPDTLGLDTLHIVGLAEGENGKVGVSEPPTVLTLLDRLPPTIEFVRPTSNTTVPIADSVRIEVRLTDNLGIEFVEMIGLAFRGDASLGTDTAVLRYEPKTVTLHELPTDTLLTRYLLPTEDRTSELVGIIVQAVDALGNVGVDTVMVAVGGPRVEFRSPTPGQVVQSGRHVGVQVAASDPSGVNRVEIVYSGVVSGTITYNYTQVRDSIVADTVIAIPDGLEGSLELRATAYNAAGIPGRTDPVFLDVQTTSVPDETPPVVGLTIESRTRMELSDSVRVTVTARDDDAGSGITMLGITALAVKPAGTDTVVAARTQTFSVPRTGTVIREFTFAPFHVDPLALPDSVIYHIHAFAVDSAGNCAAAVDSGEHQLGCTVYQGERVASQGTGKRVDAFVVAGRTVMLPDGGLIADAIVEMDTANSQYRLYLSNLRRNQIEVLNLADSTFSNTPIRVGAQPWGLFIDPSQDTLFVANSGGTNISLVQLGATPQELTSERLLTPEAVLYEIHYQIDEKFGTKYTVLYHGFSDRPQFVARDSVGRLLYSTRPTGAAPDGTIRVVDRDPVPGTSADQPEIRILFDPSEAITPADNVIAVANVDSILTRPDPFGNDHLVFFTHRPGFPDSTVWASTEEGLTFTQALDSLIARSGNTAILQKPGRWVLEKIGMSDTTYVSASGDRGVIAFGEGATNPTGRVLLWDAAKAEVSHEVSVRDLVDNASDRVKGVGLNENGSLGVARGDGGAYFFDRNLRMVGSYEMDFGRGSAGAALHWAHDHPLLSGEAALAFIGASDATIRVIDTLHFDEVAKIAIRDNIVGPLRVAPPLPTDNGGQGASCAGPNCVVAKLYGVTAAGGVVVLDVRRRDITP